MIDMFAAGNQFAAKIRDVYEAFIRQGFTASEALELTKAILCAGRR